VEGCRSLEAARLQEAQLVGVALVEQAEALQATLQLKVQRQQDLLR
jgi:hypothetical protein